MNLSGKKFITDKDILVTSGKFGGKGNSENSSSSDNFGSQLSEVLDKLQDEINELKGNVKWIYKYGGVGKGGSSSEGSGTTPSTPTGTTTLTATLNGVSLTEKNAPTIILSNANGNTHKISLSMTNPNGDKYNIICRVSYNGFTRESTTTLPASNGMYIGSLNAQIPDNADVSVFAYNTRTGSSTTTISARCVVNAVKYTYTYCNLEGKNVLSGNNEVFLDDITSGLLLKVGYTISIDYKSAEAIFIYKGLTYTLSITGNTGTLILPLIEDPSDDDAGSISVTFKSNIQPSLDGAEIVSEENTDTLLIIPNDFYVMCIPDKGSIYNSLLEDNYYKFDLNTKVSVVAYDGKIDYNNSYKILYALVPVALANSYTFDTTDLTMYLNERERGQSFTIAQTEEGWYALIISCTEKSYRRVHYIYFNEYSLANYYKSSIDTSKMTLWYYRSNLETKGAMFESYRGHEQIILRNVGDPIVFLGLLNLGTDSVGTHIAIGFLFSQVNSDDKPFITIHTSTSGGSDMSFYPTKVKFSTNDTTGSNYYLPRVSALSKNANAEYHLLTFVSRLKYKKELTNIYENIVYIDGVPECAYALLGTATNVESITINPCNTYVNLIDVGYYEVTTAPENGYYSGLNDIDENIYYYAYLANLCGKTDLKAKLDSLTNFSGFLFDEKQWIEVTDLFIKESQLTSGVPTLILKYKASADLTSGVQVGEGTFSKFLDYIDEDHSKGGDTDGSAKFPVTVEYYKENSDVASYNGSQDFTIKIQGTSTKGYRSKNLDLEVGLPNDDNFKTLYTPNFALDDELSFIPEKKFTLKADVVDSSHSNNNAIGMFVNKNTTPFIDRNDDTTKYIKNCLEGFPVLIFIKDEDTARLFYMGIYNFNLGRASDFNLGYYNNSALERVIASIDTLSANGEFLVITVDASDDSFEYKNALTVAEILDGNKYFDFSLTDSSILFTSLDDEGNVAVNGMFGDIVPGTTSTLSTDQNRIQTFVENVAKAGGYIFKQLKKRFVNQSYGYTRTEDDNDPLNFHSYNGVPDVTKLWEAYPSGKGTAYRTSSTKLINSSDLTEDKLNDLILYNENNPVVGRLNYTSAVEYYTVCMALGLVDSVLKNLNIKTFNSGNTFCIAFYDMDTSFGKDNSGNDVAWFAFSDFWQEVGGGIRNYTDFYPTRTDENETIIPIGYDIPSSYLFAVAKYASMFLSESELKNPNTLWALWRSSTGELRNAEYFVSLYFRKHLEKVNDALFALNYRFKYLRVNTIGDKTAQFSNDCAKLTGKNVNRVIDWLNGRFHILDAYFNINGLSIPFGYRDDSTGMWKEHETLKEPMPNKEIAITAKKNEDVIVAHDIFSVNETTRISMGGTITFKALKYSPLVVTVGEALDSRFLITDPEEEYLLTINNSGTLTYLIGGSANITEITNVAPFIVGGALNIYSNTLNKITGTTGSCSSINLSTPSILDIVLTSPTFSGTFVADGSVDDSYPNLQSIDISHSSINLNIKSEGVLEIKANDVTAESIKIIDCDYLNTLQIINSNLDSVYIDPISAAVEISSDINADKIYGITDLTLIGKGAGTNVSVVDDRKMLKLRIDNAETIYVAGCRNLIDGGLVINATSALKSIVIHDATNLKSLNLLECTELETLNVSTCTGLTEIILPSSALATLKVINISNTAVKSIKWDGVVASSLNLSLATKLTTFYCNNNTGLTAINFPNKSNPDAATDRLRDHVSAAVKVNSFSGCANLTTITGNILVLNPEEAFYNCHNFKLMTTYCGRNVTTKLNGNICMPYELEHYTERNIVPISEVATLDLEDSNYTWVSMDVKYQSGKNDTNISFSSGKFTRTFANTSIDLFGIYYILCNLPKGNITLDNTFSYFWSKDLTNYWDNGSGICNGINVPKLFGLVSDRTYVGEINRYMLHNTGSTTIITSWNNVFDGREGVKQLPSPTYKEVAGEIVWNEDGWYSPLRKTCGTFCWFGRYYYYSGRTNAHMRPIIDNKFFYGNGTIVTTNINGLDRAYISSRAAFNPNAPESTDGDATGFFTPFEGLMTSISDIIFGYANVETLRVPDSVTSLKFFGTFKSPANNHWNLYPKNEGDNSVFSSSSLLTTIGSHCFEGCSETIFNFDNYTFSNLQKVTSILASDSDELNFANGCTKTIDCENFPYDVLKPMTKLTTVGEIFKNTLSTGGDAIELPGNLFDGLKSLVSIKGLFSNLLFDFTIGSNGFYNKNLKISNVSKLFANNRIHLKSHIPPKLFRGLSLTDMSYCFSGDTIPSYVNTTPTSVWDYDGVNGYKLNKSVSDSTDSTHTYVDELDDEHLLVSDTNITGLDYWNVNKVHCNTTEYSATSELDLHFCCAPDLFKYCTNSSSLDISNVFNDCGIYRTSDGTLKGTLLNPGSYGIKGRIPPYLFSPVSNVINLSGMFYGCENLSYYQTYKKDEDGNNLTLLVNVRDENNNEYTQFNVCLYPIPKTLFSYTKATDYSSMFSNCIFPKYTDLETPLSKIDLNLSINVDSMFKCTLFVPIDVFGTLDTYIVDMKVFGKNVSMNYMFASLRGDTYRYIRNKYALKLTTSESNPIYCLAFKSILNIGLKPTYVFADYADGACQFYPEIVTSNLVPKNTRNVIYNNYSYYGKNANNQDAWVQYSNLPN